MDFFFTKEDLEFIAAFPAAISEDYRKDAFHRGIISKTDETGDRYVLNDFYGMLDVFAVSQTEKYHTLPKETRKALDDWYFQEYFDGLDPDPKVRPTEDAVLTLEEMYAYIDGQERQAYLNYCDCRSLTGDCGLPTRTCITYRDGINGFADRGLSKAITKEEAKEIVRMADEAGLMHTANPNGLCNCCGDCCYLFRSQRLRHSQGFWPRSPYIVEMDPEKCISCGKCIKRCHFGIFSRESAEKRARVILDIADCVGCGLCVNTCPAKALQLKKRDER